MGNRRAAARLEGTGQENLPHGMEFHHGQKDIRIRGVGCTANWSPGTILNSIFTDSHLKVCLFVLNA